MNKAKKDVLGLVLIGLVSGGALLFFLMVQIWFIPPLPLWLQGLLLYCLGVMCVFSFARACIVIFTEWWFGERWFKKERRRIRKSPRPHPHRMVAKG